MTGRIASRRCGRLEATATGEPARVSARFVPIGPKGLSYSNGNVHHRPMVRLPSAASAVHRPSLARDHAARTRVTVNIVNIRG